MKFTNFFPTPAARSLPKIIGLNTRSNAPEMSLRKPPILLPVQIARIHFIMSTVTKSLALRPVVKAH